MKPPAFQFYADDFIGGTCDLSALDVGAYIRLLCYQWNRGSIPVEDQARLERIAGTTVSGDVLAKFPGGKNKRLESVRKKQNEYRALQSFKGKASAKARLNRGSTEVQPDTQPKLNSPTPSPTPNKRHRATPVAPTSDSEWLADLAKNPAYSSISVPTEFAKMQAWCAANRKEPTRRRFVNWLNRCDKPVAPSAAYRANPAALDGPEGWRDTLRRLYQMDAPYDGSWATLAESARRDVLAGKRLAS